jgi:DNA phosphorothioation-associated putative methyltransferase
MFPSLQVISQFCQSSPFGKRLPKALYIHYSALTSLSTLLQSYEQQAKKLISPTDVYTLIKFSIDQLKISYLFYPDFDNNPHPALISSKLVNLETQQIRDRYYHHSKNPPILHRKETFVTPDYPLYDIFAHLTQTEESLGLLKNSQHIGTRQGWQKRLNEYQIAFVGHNLVCPLPYAN